MTIRAARAVAVLAAGAALAFAGCGSDDDSGNGGGGGGGGDDAGGGGGGGAYGGGGGDSTEAKSGGGGATRLKLSADPSGAPKFDKTSLSAKPGKVTVVMDNPSDVPHAVEVEGQGVEAEGKTVGKGGVSRVTVDVKKGEYEFYCPVGSHADAGMEGTLTVQ
jgi:plastocyanin